MAQRAATAGVARSEGSDWGARPSEPSSEAAFARRPIPERGAEPTVELMHEVPVAPGSRPPPAAPSPPGRRRELEPTEKELRTSIRLLLHIARQGRFGPGEIPPGSLTQAGMSTALGTSQGAVSNSLGRLVDGGVLEVERGHVRGRVMRVKFYRLTARGEELVRRLRERFPD